MSLTSQTSAPPERSGNEPDLDLVDASSRSAVASLVGCGLIWLVFSLVLGLAASIQMHSPGFLAGTAWLSFGRIYPASVNAFLYGFAIQLGLAVTFWMLCRSGRTLLYGAKIIGIGVLFWNLALMIGVWAILAGRLTGFENLEIPGSIAFVMFLSYGLMAIPALITFHRRRRRDVYVSQWHLFAAIFCFAWIYSSAYLLLCAFPARGVVQALVAQWYGHNLEFLWTTLIGLAIVFYWIPKLLARPLYSYEVALCGFWTLLLFGSWGGIHAGGPWPKWVASMSIVGVVLTGVAVLAVIYNLAKTFQGEFRRIGQSGVFLFVGFATAAFAASYIVYALNASRSVGEVTHFSLFGLAGRTLQWHGFFGMAAAGAVYGMAPSLFQVGPVWESRMKLHFALAAGGVLLSFFALLAGGFFHGMALNSPNVQAVDVARLTLPFTWLNTLALIALLAGQVVFAVNVFLLMAKGCVSCCYPNFRMMSAGEARTAEASV